MCFNTPGRECHEYPALTYPALQYISTASSAIPVVANMAARAIRARFAGHQTVNRKFLCSHPAISFEGDVECMMKL